jgi:WD40 repeat protein
MPGTLLRFVTVGEKHLKVHKITVDSRGDLAFEARIPVGYAKTNIVQKCYTDACYLENGNLAVATVSGHIYLYDGESQDFLKYFKAHEGPVGALTALDKGFASGGSDGCLRSWDINGKQVHAEIRLDPKSSKKAVVRSLDSLNGRLIVGTKNCEIFETSFDDGLTKMVMCGHTDEVWGLATHPTKPVMAVAGDDMVVRVWDFKAKKVLLKVRCKAAVKVCCCFLRPPACLLPASCLPASCCQPASLCLLPAFCFLSSCLLPSSSILHVACLLPCRCAVSTVEARDWPWALRTAAYAC